jgi:hypothetical protein
MTADARPGMVRARIAVEPRRPPFLARPLGRQDRGLTAAPLTFDPPLTDPAALTDGTPGR